MDKKDKKTIRINGKACPITEWDRQYWERQKKARKHRAKDRIREYFGGISEDIER